MKTIATVMQITRGLLILTPAEYDKPDGGFATKTRKSGQPTVFNIPQIFELNDSLKEHPFEKTEELASFVKRCAESVSMELGELFLCIEDEDVLITKEYKHAPAKDKLLPTFARVEAENLLHQEAEKYTILNFEYGQQYGKANKSEDISASLFAMNTGILTDIRANFERQGIRIVKVVPPIAGLLSTAKEDMNSSTKAIAVISADFAATRLIVLHNGAPIFQQSFSSVLEDVAEQLSLEFGMSKMGAIDLIRQEGLGVCNKCKSASTRKQTMTMLDNALGEIIRNLRMVISTKRLDIDEIVFCDCLAKLPNLQNYCRQQGLTAPSKDVRDVYSSSAVPPTVTDGAQNRDYGTYSFVTLNGVLTMPLNEANLLMGETNVLSAMAAQGGNKIGNLVAGIICGGVALWMIAVGGTWFAKQMQKNNDDAALVDPAYQTAKDLIKDEKILTESLKNIKEDLARLPKATLQSSDIVEQTFAQVVDKVKRCDSFNIANSSNNSHTVTSSIELKDFNTFVDFKNEINDGKYFVLSNNYSVSETQDEKSGGTNPVKSASVSVVLNVTEEQMAKAQEEADAKAAEKEAASSGNSTNQSSGTAEASNTASS